MGARGWSSDTRGPRSGIPCYSRTVSVVCSATIQPTVSEAIMSARIIELKLSPKYVIDVSKPFHVSWWAATLGVTEEEVIEAVTSSGARAIDAFRYLCRERKRSTDTSPPRRLRNLPGNPPLSAAALPDLTPTEGNPALGRAPAPNRLPDAASSSLTR